MKELVIDLPKEIRHEIYANAKREYMEYVEFTHKRGQRPLSGMCYFLEQELLKVVSLKIRKKIEQEPGFNYLCFAFPEFIRQMPIRMSCDTYWWEISDTNSRIKAFDSMLKETE